MNLQKALNILGLNSNYTEEQLNKAYKKAAKKYHPDLFEQKSASEKKYAENKMKEINEAKTFLEENLKSKKQEDNNTLIMNLKRNADDYLKKMQEACGKIKYTYISNQEIPMKIIAIITILEKELFTLRLHIKHAKNKSSIDNYLKDAKIGIKEAYETIKNIFYQEKYINSNNVKTSLNYDCDIIEFYNQLLIIEDKYSDKTIFNKQIEEIIHTYENYQGYQQTKDLITFYLNQAKNKAKQNKYQNNDKILKETHEIILKIFEEYHEVKTEIINLETTVNQTNDDEIKELYNKIKKDFELGTNFHDIKRAIDKLKITCEKTIEKRKKLNVEKPETTKLYYSLLSKANNTLSKLNIIDDLEKINKIHEIISKIIEIFKLYTENLIDIDKLLSLNEITFEELDKDLTKLNNIITSSKSKTTIRAKDYSEKHHTVNYQTFGEPIAFNDGDEYQYREKKQYIENKKIRKK